jgi:hypothetical protein
MKLWKLLVILFCLLIGPGISYGGFISNDPGLSPGQTLPPGLIIPGPIISNPQLSGLITTVPGSTLWVQGNVQYEPYAQIAGPNGSIWNVNGISNLANLTMSMNGRLVFPDGSYWDSGGLDTTTHTVINGPDGGIWDNTGIHNLLSLSVGTLVVGGKTFTVPTGPYQTFQSDVNGNPIWNTNVGIGQAPDPTNALAVTGSSLLPTLTVSTILHTPDLGQWDGNGIHLGSAGTQWWDNNGVTSNGINVHGPEGYQYGGAPVGGVCAANSAMTALSGTLGITCQPFLPAANPTFTGTMTGPAINLTGAGLSFSGTPMFGTCAATMYVSGISATGVLSCSTPAGSGGGGSTLPTPTGPFQTLQTASNNAVVWNTNVGIGQAPTTSALAVTGATTLTGNLTVATTATVTLPDGTTVTSAGFIGNNAMNIQAGGGIAVARFVYGAPDPGVAGLTLLYSNGSSLKWFGGSAQSLVNNSLMLSGGAINSSGNWQPISGVTAASTVQMNGANIVFTSNTGLAAGTFTPTTVATLNGTALNLASGVALQFNSVGVGGSCAAGQFMNTLSSTLIPGCAVAGVTIASAAPASPALGQLWFNTADVQTYIFYNDGTSSQWVPVINNGAGGNILNNPTFTGVTTFPDGSTWTGTGPTIATTSTMTFPDGSTYTSAGHNTMKALGIGQVAVANQPVTGVANYNGNMASVFTNNSTGANAQNLMAFQNTGVQMPGNIPHQMFIGIEGMGFTAGNAQQLADTGIVTTNATGTGGMSLAISTNSNPVTYIGLYNNSQMALMVGTTATGSLLFMGNPIGGTAGATGPFQATLGTYLSSGYGTYLTSGVHINGSNQWIADLAYPSLINLSENTGSNSSAITFFVQPTAITVGAVFGPNLVAQIASQTLSVISPGGAPINSTTVPIFYGGNVNAQWALLGQNTNTGTSAYSQVELANGNTTMNMMLYGQGFPTSGMVSANWGQIISGSNMSIVSQGGGGIYFANSNAGPTILYMLGSHAYLPSWNSTTGYYMCVDTTSSQLYVYGGSCVASSLKLKTDIHPITDAISTISRLADAAIYFHYRDRHDPDERYEHPGFGAEWVEQIDPRYATHNLKTGVADGVHYEEMTATEAVAIRDLQKEIDDLKKAVHSR